MKKLIQLIIQIVCLVSLTSLGGAYTLDMSQNGFHLANPPYDFSFSYDPDGVSAYAKAWDGGNVTQYTRSSSFYIRPDSGDPSIVEPVEVQVRLIHSGSDSNSIVGHVSGYSSLKQFTLDPTPHFIYFFEEGGGPRDVTHTYTLYTMNGMISKPMLRRTQVLQKPLSTEPR